MCSRPILILALFFSATSLLSGQISHGGLPLNWSSKEQAKLNITSTVLGPLTKQETDLFQKKQVGAALQYGVQRFFSVDVLAQGDWESLPNGREVCRYRISSEGAVMLSLQFSAFKLEPGAELFIYNESRANFLGSFTTANERPSGKWASGVLAGDALIVEYIRPQKKDRGIAQIQIASLTHGILDVLKLNKKAGGQKDFFPGAAAAPCQLNITCPEGANWRDVGNSVAMLLRPDGATCSGSLMNNTAEDGTPYFYIANHCYQANSDQWIFYFNYESPTCIGDTGSTANSILGATLRASSFSYDFALVELDAVPPASFDVTYNGWDNSGAIPDSSVLIGHPQGDVKKISFDAQVPSTQTSLNYGTTVWHAFWDVGGPEFGSSGSPFINHDKRVQGLMSDGFLDCNSNFSISEIARLSDHWNGVASSTRLRDWLDPINSNATTLDSYSPNTTTTSITLPLKCLLQGPMDLVTGLMNDALRTQALLPLTEPYSAMGHTFMNNSIGASIDAGVLQTSGVNAVVDWILVELRDKSDSSIILYAEAGLLLRDGTIVGLDGVSPLALSVSPDDYYIGIRHRNHLPILTATAVTITAGMAQVDLSSSSAAVLGGSNAGVHIGAFFCMAMGDVAGNQNLKYVGSGNDRDLILQLIGGSGYLSADVNLDGVVKYVGSTNDRDPILVNIGGSVPTVVREAFYP